MWGSLNGGYFEYGSLSLYTVDVVIILLLLFWFFRKSLRHIYVGPKFVMLPLMMFILWITASVFWAQDALVSVAAAAHYWLFFVWLVYLINEIKDWRKILWPFVAGVGFQAIVGIAQYLSNSSVGLAFLGESILDPGAGNGIPVIGEGSSQLRAHGMLPHANMLGGLMTASLPIFWYLYHKAEPYRRQLLLLLMMLTGVALALSYSRAAWATLILIAIAGIIVGFRTKNKILFQAIGITMLAFMLALGPQASFVLSRFNTQAAIEQISIDERIEGYKQWQQMINDNSVRGVGVGNYALSLKELDSARESWWYQPVHNIYLLITGELGVIGAAIWLWLITAVLCLGWRDWRDRQATMLIFLTPISIWLLGLVDHWPISLQQGRLLLFLALALTILTTRVSYKGHTSRKE